MPALSQARLSWSCAAREPLDVELSALAERLGVPLRLHGYVAPDRAAGALPRGRRARARQHLRAVRRDRARGRRGRAAADLLGAGGAAGDVAVDGENALLVDPADRGGDRRRRWAGWCATPELRGRLAAGSRAVTERHPLEADAEAFERAVLKAAGG